MQHRLLLCKNCRSLFEPYAPPSFGDVLPDSWLCSWHPGQAELVGNGGARDSYVDYFRWSCCGQSSSGAVIGGLDFPARRSPGCQRGPHIEDLTLNIDPSLEKKLQSLQERLIELETRKTMNSKPSNVFISYSHTDSKFVDRLARRFEADEILYWRDEKDILVGDVIDRAISEGIQRNALFLLVLSPASLKSKWVQREIDEAAHELADGQKIVLPVLTGGLRQEEVPARLRRIKCADLNASNDAALDALIHSVRTHIARQSPSAA